MFCFRLVLPDQPRALTQIFLYEAQTKLSNHKLNSLKHKTTDDVYLEEQHNQESESSDQSNGTKFFLPYQITDKNIQQLRTFKCTECFYEGKRKCDLDRHVLVHKNDTELQMFGCSECSFTTKRRDSLRRHKKHRNYAKKLEKSHVVVVEEKKIEVPIFKCAHCSYQTRKKINLKYHVLIHRDHETTFKCHLCLFVTNRQTYLNKHVKRHNGK